MQDYNAAHYKNLLLTNQN